MAEKVVLAAEKRELTGKKARALRKNGVVPGVIYGAKLAATNVQFAPVALEKVLAKVGKHAPVEIDLAGKKYAALVKSVDYAPARSEITHISWQAVSATEKVTTEVPIRIAGIDESAAKKAGLVILPTLETLEVRAVAADLPDEIVVDASKLANAEEKLTIADADLPKNVEVVDYNPELVVATVWEPAALEAHNNENEPEAAPATEVADEAAAPDDAKK